MREQCKPLKTEMKKTHFIVIVGGVVLGIILVYYTSGVLIVRHNIPHIVQKVLRSNAIKLQLSDLSPRQMEIL